MQKLIAFVAVLCSAALVALGEDTDEFTPVAGRSKDHRNDRREDRRHDRDRPHTTPDIQPDQRAGEGEAVVIPDVPLEVDELDVPVVEDRRSERAQRRTDRAAEATDRREEAAKRRENRPGLFGWLASVAWWFVSWIFWPFSLIFTLLKWGGIALLVMVALAMLAIGYLFGSALFRFVLWAFSRRRQPETPATKGNSDVS